MNLIYLIGNPKPYEIRVLWVFFLATVFTSAYVLIMPLILAPPIFLCYDAQSQTFKCEEEQACSNQWGFIIDSVKSLDSLILQFGLYCSKNDISNMIASSNFLGGFVGFIIYMLFYDNKRNAFETGLKTIAICSILALLTIFCFDYVSIMIMRFLFNIFSCGIQIIGYSYLMEMAGSNTKFFGFCIIIINTAWGIGSLYIASMALISFSWKSSLTLYCGIPLALLGIYFWTLKKYQIDYLVQKDIEAENSRYIKSIECGESPTYNIENITHNTLLQVLKYKSLYWRTILMTMLSIAINGSYFGILLSLPTLEGNIPLNMILLAIFEVASYIMGGMVLSRLRRKLTLLIIFAINVMIFLLFLFINSVNGSKGILDIIMALIGKFCVCGSMVIFGVYFAELIPESVIRTVYGMVNYILTLFLIFLPELISKLDFIGISPFIAISVFNLVGLIAIIFLPETLGIKLPQMTQEEKQLRDNKVFNLKEVSSFKNETL